MNENYEEVDLIGKLIYELENLDDDPAIRKAKMELLAELLRCNNKVLEMEAAAKEAEAKLDAEREANKAKNKATLWAAMFQLVGIVLGGVITVGGNYAIEKYKQNGGLAMIDTIFSNEKDGYTMSGDSKMIVNKRIHM